MEQHYLTNWRSVHNSKSGFTLIEMLVVVAIATLFVGGGLAGFMSFNSRQKAINGAKELEQIIKIAETKTQSGVVGVCNQLEAYEITFDTAVDPVIVSLQEVCATGEVVTPVATEYPLSQGVSMSFSPATTYIRFKILSGGLLFSSGASSIQAQFEDANNPGQVYAVTISEGGDVSEGDWL